MKCTCGLSVKNVAPLFGALILTSRSHLSKCRASHIRGLNLRELPLSVLTVGPPLFQVLAFPLSELPPFGTLLGCPGNHVQLRFCRCIRQCRNLDPTISDHFSQDSVVLHASCNARFPPDGVIFGFMFLLLGTQLSCPRKYYSDKKKVATQIIT